MKNLLLAIGALLVITGIFSVNLWLDLRTERSSNAQVRTRLAEARATLGTPTASSPLSTVPALASMSPGAPNASATSAPVAGDPEAELKATAAAVSSGAVAAARGTSEADLLKDPEYRKAQLTQTRLRLALSNPGLAETLGLSQVETTRLFDAMAEGQLNRTAQLAEIIQRAGGASAMPAMTELVRDAAREDPARAMLGEARYAQYQEYQRNIRPALTQVASIGSSLNAAGQPLNDLQTRMLTAAMMTEQQRQRQEAAMPRPNLTPGVPRSLASSLEESANRQQASNRRILEASAASLNPAQLEVLNQQFEQQDASRRRSIETAREFDGGRPTTAQPSAPPVRTP